MRLSRVFSAPTTSTTFILNLITLHLLVFDRYMILNIVAEWATFHVWVQRQIVLCSNSSDFQMNYTPSVAVPRK